MANGKTKFEKIAERMFAGKVLTSVTGSFSDRVKRIYEKDAVEVSNRLKKKESLPKGSNLVLKLGWSDEAMNWARGISLSLEEFKQVNPRAYKQFEEIRAKHKEVRRAYLEFSGQVLDEIYISLIREIIGEEKISEKQAINLYDSIKDLGEKLGKEKPIYRFLLPE